MRAAISGHWADVNGKLCSVPRRQAFADDLDAPRIVDRNIDVHARFVPQLLPLSATPPKPHGFSAEEWPHLRCGAACARCLFPGIFLPNRSLVLLARPALHELLADACFAVKKGAYKKNCRREKLCRLEPLRHQPWLRTANIYGDHALASPRPGLLARGCALRWWSDPGSLILSAERNAASRLPLEVQWENHGRYRGTRKTVRVKKLKQ